jgi:GTPase SAR1 family protein
MGLGFRVGEGQNYQAIQSTYYKGARCAVIVFDVTSRKSFQNVEHWMSEVAKYAEGPIPIVLVATKSDLWEERVVTAQDADEWAAEQSYACRAHPMLRLSARLRIPEPDPRIRACFSERSSLYTKFRQKTVATLTS